MKKLIPLLLIVSVFLASCGNTFQEANDTYDSQSDTTQDIISEAITDGETNILGGTDVEPDFGSDIDSESKQNATTALDGKEYVLEYIGNPVYSDVSISDVHATGAATTYDEVMDPSIIRENLTILRYEIVSIYSAEEARSITGKDYFNDIATLYKAHVTYDYVNDTKEDYFINISENGGEVSQRAGFPIYEIGQCIISPVYFELSDRATSIGELRYSVYEVNGVEMAYHIGYENIKAYDLSLVNIDLYMDPSENAILTSTMNNPEEHTQKSTVNDLTAFLARDFESRGVINVGGDY